MATAMAPASPSKQAQAAHNVSTPAHTAPKTLGSTASPVSVAGYPKQSSVASKPPEAAGLDIPRTEDLEKKRLLLCHQRVRLERQLFEVSQSHLPTHNDNETSDIEVGVALPSHPQTEQPQSWTSHHVCGFLVQFERTKAHWTGPVTEVQEERNNKDDLARSSQDGKVLKPNGRGILEFENGQRYEGHVVWGRRQGFGRNAWPDGQVYVGGWENNSRAGRGSHTWPDGKTVTGQWTDGHLNGRCFFQWPDGATYDGDTIKGKKHGRGVHTWKDGRIYKGQYEGGHEHGFGTLTEADGLCRYRGQFRRGQRHGYGTQIWRGKTYEGEWEHNVVSGRGKLSWKNGALYQGHFSRGKYHGNGSFTDKTGRKYVGDWVAGEKEGTGRETWPQTGQVYVGSYLSGKKHGFGRLTFADGGVYVGGWNNGRRNGCWGIQTNTNGEVFHCGLWREDKPFRPDNVGKSDGPSDDSAVTEKRRRTLRLANRMQSPHAWEVHDAEFYFRDNKTTCVAV